MRRVRVSAVLIVGAMLVVGLTDPRAQTTMPSTRLTLGGTIERSLDGYGRETFDVRAALGDYVRVRVDERGIDVAVELTGPTGGAALTTQTNLRPFGSEVLAFIAAAEGLHRIVVSPTDRAAPAGRIVVQLQNSRPATVADHAAVEGVRQFEQAVRLRSANTRAPQAGARATVIAVLDAARERFVAAGDSWGESRVSIELAAEALQDEQTVRVSPAIHRAIALATAMHDTQGLGLAHLLDGLAHLRAGRNAEAAAATKTAQRFASAVGDLPTAALAVNNLGILNNRLGDAEGAYDAFQEALALRTSTGLGMSEAALRVNLGRVAQVLGRFDEARALFADAAEQHKAAGETDFERIAAANLADVLRRLGDPEGALRQRERTLVLARALHDARAEAMAFEGLGGDLFQLRRLSEAELHQRRALELRREIRDLDGEAVALLGLGQSLHALGRSDEGLLALEQSVTLRQRFENARALPPIWRAIGVLERDRGRLPQAIAAFEQALSGVEHLRDTLTSPALRASFTATEADTYADYVDALMQAAREHPGASFVQRAFEASDRGRARMLLEGLMTARVEATTGLPRALLDEERTLQQSLSDSRAMLSRALGSGATPDAAASARASLARASDALDRVQARLRRASPEYGALIRPDPVRLADVQRQVVDAGTVLLEYQLGLTKSWVWAVTPSGLESFELPPRAVIENAVRELRSLYDARAPRPDDTAAAARTRVRDADASLPRAATELSTMLLGPLASRLARDWTSRRLAIVAGDALGYVPFAALPLPGRAQSLVDSHEVVLLPSASTVLAMRRVRPVYEGRPVTVAIVADPVFDDRDPRLARATPGRRVAADHGPRTSLDRVLRSVSDQTGRGVSRLPRLAFSRFEATAISRLVRPEDLSVWTDFEANREALSGAAVGAADIVHLATHALVSPHEPALTGLVVSLVDRDARPKDGFLRLNDIYNLRLRARLVVLSACQTALGQEVRGEGLVGLTRGFMHAGATQVVASLWPVDDAATAELMSRFYRGLLRQGLSTSAALRAAQREMSSDPQWASPYFWAGFVLQGDWR